MHETLPLLKQGIANPHRILPYLRRQLGTTPLLQNDVLYRVWLASKGASQAPSHPDLSTTGDDLAVRTLQTTLDTEAAVAEVRSLGLHPHPGRPKNWDALAALKAILRQTGPHDRVLDAGGAVYSPLVEWLYLYGYTDLYVYNIDFDGDFNRGPIQFRDADLTATDFPAETVSVVTCLSVIEHGLDLRATLEEFYRILEPGGLVFLSTDYWPEKIDTSGRQTAYGAATQPWEIFDRGEIKQLLETADDVGFRTPDDREFTVTEPTATSKGEAYTFLYAELAKPE